jgi:hypothetical protein
MRTTLRLNIHVITIILLILGIAQSRGALKLKFAQTSDSIVTATVSGSLNLLSLNYAGEVAINSASLVPNIPILYSAPPSVPGTSGYTARQYILQNADRRPWGTGQVIQGNHKSGLIFGFVPSAFTFYIDPSYVSNTPYYSVSQFHGTLESLGLDQFHRTMTFENNSVSDTFTISTIPGYTPIITDETLRIVKMPDETLKLIASNTLSGFAYTMQQSTDLQNWTDVSSKGGNDGSLSWDTISSSPKIYFRIWKQ